MTTTKYRLKLLSGGARPIWTLLHPDGFWVGPGLGEFSSIAEGIDWVCAQAARS